MRNRILVVFVVLLSLVVSSAMAKHARPAKHRPTHRKVANVTLPKFVWGKIVWVYQFSGAEHGDPVKIAKKAKHVGLDGILVKTNDGGKWYRGTPKKSFKKLLKECHKLGVRVYAWGYVYGNKPKVEAQRAIEAMKMGADGYVFNAESHFRNKPHSAKILAGTVRNYVAKYAPKKVLGYSTFCRINKQGGIPYEIFDRYCNVAMPQLYWVEFRGWNEDNAAYRMMAIWNVCFNKWGRCPKPIAPTLHAYRATGNTALVPPEELKEIAKSLSCYVAGVNYYVWEKMGKAHWKVVAQAPGSLKYQRTHNMGRIRQEAKRLRVEAKKLAQAEHKQRLERQKRLKHLKALRAQARHRQHLLRHRGRHH